MADKSENKSANTTKNVEVYFKCIYCGETRHLDDLVVMRQFYPLISVCKDCAKSASYAH
jgi:hypothetical protein